MLEYTKEILQKVSFDKYLFRKELMKALKWLRPDEKKVLMAWCIAHFGQQYATTLTQVFRKFS